jgi:hypothetical protein
MAIKTHVTRLPWYIRAMSTGLQVQLLVITEELVFVPAIDVDRCRRHVELTGMLMKQGSPRHELLKAAGGTTGTYMKLSEPVFLGLGP